MSGSLFIEFVGGPLDGDTRLVAVDSDRAFIVVSRRDLAVLGPTMAGERKRDFPIGVYLRMRSVDDGEVYYVYQGER